MKNLLRPKEAARRLKVNVYTLRQWHNAGRIKAIRTEGGHCRYPLSEVKRFERLWT